MKTNKNPIILIVLSILIILFTLLIQISDSNISDFNNNIVINQGALIDILIKRVTARINEHQYNLYQIFQPEVSFKPAQNLESSPELDEIVKKYDNKEITKEEAFLLFRAYFGTEYDELTKEYNSKAIDINHKISNGSPWVFWRNVFIVCVLILIFLQLYLSLLTTSKIKTITQ